MSYTGGGHRSLALAIKEGLLQLAPQAQVIMTDIFAHLPFPLSRVGELYEPVVQYSRGLWQLIWDLTENPEKAERLIKVIAPLAKPTLRKLLQDLCPDAIVSVYPLCNHALAQVRQELRLSIPQVTVVLDLISIHPSWGCPDVDYCVVPTKLARQQILQYGVPAERVKLLGLPVRLGFAACQWEKDALRTRLNLRQDLFTLLLMGGGEGMGPLLDVSCALDAASLPLQLLVVAGSNEKLRRRLTQRSWRGEVHVFGFVERLWELMRASDVLVTKAGPETVCEGLNTGLPILIFDALPGQETGTADYVVSHGAGLLTASSQELVDAIRELLQDNGQRLVYMTAQARALARPQAAADTAQLILKEVGFEKP